MHSAVEQPQSWVLGISSVHEMTICRAALSPASSKVFKAHLLDVVDGPDGTAVMKLRNLDGSVVEHCMPAGAILINCTDSLGTPEQTEQWKPIISADGLVLAPQFCLGFSGPSACQLTHLWYLGKLSRLWKKFIRVGSRRPQGRPVGGKEKAWENKEKGKGVEALYMLVFNSIMVAGAMPFSISSQDKSNPLTTLPAHRRLPAFLSTIYQVGQIWEKHMQIMPLRYTDPRPGEKAQHEPSKPAIAPSLTGVARLIIPLPAASALLCLAMAACAVLAQVIVQ
jgi:hypothetical protein